MAGAEDKLTNNPFAGLFESVDKAQQFSASIQDRLLHFIFLPADPVPSASQEAAFSDEDVDSAISRVFLITLNPELSLKQSACCVHLEDLQESLSPLLHLALPSLEQAVFERLMLQNPDDMLVNRRGATKLDSEDAAEKDPMKYLFLCYLRLHRIADLPSSLVDKFTEIIVMNAKTGLSHPEIFADDYECGCLIVDMLLASGGRDSDWILDLLQRASCLIHEDPDESLADALKPILIEIHMKFMKGLTLAQGPVVAFCQMLNFFCRTDYLVDVLLTYNRPINSRSGKSYEMTLLGSMLCISCLPANGQSSFFEKPSRFTKHDVETTEANVHQRTADFNEAVFLLIKNILKSGGDAKSRMLLWIGDFLSNNKVKLAMPFCGPNCAKLLSIQPTYVLATRDYAAGAIDRNVHITGLDDTCLIPEREAENERARLKENYNFISEIFFLTHLSLKMGFQTNNERLLAINREIPRLQASLHQMIEAQAAGNSNPVHEQLKNQIENVSSEYLCLKAALSEPQLLDNFLSFSSASASFLTQLALCGTPSSFQSPSFPLPEDVPAELSCIPEFVVENIIECMLFIKRFKDNVFELNGDKLEPLMTFILVYMGSPERMNNPHLRARMAEALDALIPPSDISSTMMSGFQRKQLFDNHPLAEEITPKLLHLFVSIEMTGQGVEFEQKFNYRRPMYSIMHFLWDREKHQRALQKLAIYAEENIEAPDAPLFLRFINLLMNDAIFLLDEAMMYMAQIKEKQQERDAGSLQGLNPQQRQEAEANFQHLSMLARFHNMMGQDTIRTLVFITRHITSLFSHAVLVDRIAAMLNYFLLHLVGPKKKDLKVKDFESFEFKPQLLVENICRLYLNLSKSESFCSAIIRDGRSYSHDLFVQAGRVLMKIVVPHDLLEEFIQLGNKVKHLAESHEAEEEALADAPEEFLDPIMGSLMSDPVLLPSSGQIVDRATIARHILSDQSDPFNRKPLTMEMVLPAVELKAKIDAWIAQIKNS
ncbi:hypothetical protein CAPTEDRAFT_225184 [Capitella teleta]|uniref:Ubiquitin conjugation factor E4 A n=1 Tax=Capitella teleta TaxID=283909 RepID=R7VE13_CAPTE|nr:hypothetical protein CAPTEDRAFT_225184 [Capitella teleta]|eukprot:ELU16797.1 hypothetical protein CAPTEDRAFT_225184 [Capitella teleta]